MGDLQLFLIDFLKKFYDCLFFVRGWSQVLSCILEMSVLPTPPPAYPPCHENHILAEHNRHNSSLIVGC